jgi:hypothetical protein
VLGPPGIGASARAPRVQRAAAEAHRKQSTGTLAVRVWYLRAERTEFNPRPSAARTSTYHQNAAAHTISSIPSSCITRVDCAWPTGHRWSPPSSRRRYSTPAGGTLWPDRSSDETPRCYTTSCTPVRSGAVLTIPSHPIHAYATGDCKSAHGSRIGGGRYAAEGMGGDMGGIWEG